MGVYDTYGKTRVQIKAGNDGMSMNDFFVGDKVPLPDGIYIGYEGTIIVKDGVFIAEALFIKDKYGGILNFKNIIDENNPVSQAIRDLTGI